MAKSVSKTYRKSLNDAFASTQRAVRDLGYKVDAIDRTNGLLNFKTGMSWWSWAGQEMSAMFIDNRNGTVEISIAGRRNQSGVLLQVFDWGESSGIAKKVFNKIDSY